MALAGVLVLLPPSHHWDIAALALLIVSVGAGLGGTYRMWVRAADGVIVASWLRRVPRPLLASAVQETLWNAVGRSDLAVTSTALSVALDSSSNVEHALLAWLVDHRDMLVAEWASREVQRCVLAYGLDASTAGSRSDILHTLLVTALDAEAYARAQEIIDGVMQALGASVPWAEAHAELLEKVGFALWNIGESGASAPRTARVPGQLGGVQAIFLSRLRRIWHHLKQVGNADAVEQFCGVLGSMAYETPEDSFLSRIFEVMEEGFGHHLLTEQTLHQLASDLDVSRQVARDDEHRQEWIDDLIVTLAAMLIELGEEQEVGRLLGNGGIVARRPERVNQQPWLQPASYRAVATHLGIKRL